METSQKIKTFFQENYQLFGYIVLGLIITILLIVFTYWAITCKTQKYKQFPVQLTFFVNTNGSLSEFEGHGYITPKW